MSDNRRVLILAAGECKRWEGKRPKQLLLIEGESIINRIERLAGNEAITVTHNPLIQQYVKRSFIPYHHRCTAETVFNTRSLWLERTIILLGDVIFTPAAMEDILTCDKPIAFFGRDPELFALSFDETMQSRLIGCLRKATDRAIHDVKKCGLGKLWQVYRCWCGFPLNEHRLENDVFVKIDDSTTDIDTQGEYLEYLRRYVF
jgi:hypothetical protein